MAPGPPGRPCSALIWAGKRFSSAAGNSNTPEGGTESSGWYFYHEIIEVELTVSETVAVQGVPQLELTIGSATRKAGYHSGSGSARLYFQYRVQTGDYDANGVSIPQNALKLNGGGITGASGALLLGEFSSPTQLGDAPRHKVDGAKGHSHPRYASATGTDQVYEIGTPIPELTLPAASGGNGALSYSAHFVPNCTISGTRGSSGSSGAVGGRSSNLLVGNWMIYTPPGPGDTHGGKISAAPGAAPNTFKAPTAGLRGCVNIFVHDSDDDSTTDDRGNFSFNITVKFDYDSNDDGLIEVSKLSQLDAIRYDLDGDGAQGAVSATDWAKYTAAFPDAMPGMGCPDTTADTDTLPGPCAGYELTASLNFDTNGNGHTYTEPGGVLTGDAGDAYYNGGAGWNPIGSTAAPFTAVFDGRGHTIANLFINLSTSAGTRSGLFGVIGTSGQVKDLGLLQVRASLKRALGGSGSSGLGSLAGNNAGMVSGSYATGAVSASFSGAATLATAVLNIGGLIGYNGGTVEWSYATGSVTATGRSSATSNDNFRTGGLAGRNAGKINASYATGAVQVVNGRHTGGLVGGNTGEITACYATGAVQLAHGGHPGGLVGHNWNDTARISASYAIGLVTSDANSAAAGGLLGGGDNPAGVNNYWDTGTSGQNASNAAIGKTTRQLQTPTGYTGIYAHWNLDLDGDSATGENGKDKPWDFGIGRQYPVLKDGRLTDGQQQQQIKEQRRNFLNADNWNAPAVGDPVMVSPDAPASATWQWQRKDDGAWANILAATNSSYIAAAADVGQRLRAIATYTEDGITQTLTTANTGAVVAASSVAAGVPTVLPVVGEKLRYGLSAAGATGIQAWRWQRCDDLAMTVNCRAVTPAVLPNAAHSEYTPTAGAADATDVGKYLQAHVYYTANDAAKTWTRAVTPVMGPVAAAASSSSGPTGS